MKIEDIYIPTMAELRKIAKENKIPLKDITVLANVSHLVFYSQNPTYKTIVKVYEALKQLCILKTQ